MTNAAYAFVGLVGMMTLDREPDRPLGAMLVSGSTFGRIGTITTEVRRKKDE